jgi:hypothetical protein
MRPANLRTDRSQTQPDQTLNYTSSDWNTSGTALARRGSLNQLSKQHGYSCKIGVTDLKPQTETAEWNSRGEVGAQMALELPRCVGPGPNNPWMASRLAGAGPYVVAESSPSPLLASAKNSSDNACQTASSRAVPKSLYGQVKYLERQKQHTRARRQKQTCWHDAKTSAITNANARIGSIRLSPQTQPPTQV